MADLHGDGLAHGHDHCQVDIHQASTPAYRRVLWTVFVLNAAMFGVEIIAGALSRSTSLQADALDFLGDSANYLVALFVLGRSVVWRAGSALTKAAAMLGFALYVLGYSAWQMLSGVVPEAPVMGVVGSLALLVNVGCTFLLFGHRNGDSNRRAVWLCSRNDAIANVAVIAAAGLVALTGTLWPDAIVGVFMASLALHSAWEILHHARADLVARDAYPAE